MITFFAILTGLIGAGNGLDFGAALDADLKADVGFDATSDLAVSAGGNLGIDAKGGLRVGAKSGLGLDAELGVNGGLSGKLGIGGGLDDNLGLGLYDTDLDVGLETGIGGYQRSTQGLYVGSGVDLTLPADGIVPFVGPYCGDFYRGIGCSNLCNWPYCRYGGLPIGSLGVVGANLPYVGYNGYGRTDYTRENFVRGNVFGATEVGTRNEITFRPGIPNYPYPYPYPCIGFPRCLPQLYPVDIPRPVYPYAPGLVTAGDVQRVGLPDFQYR